jgi:phosphoesterase RecJ-like protein
MIPPGDRDRFRELCESAERFVLTTHMNPDGDALGSQVGLARFLEARGKTVRVVNQDATPEILRFLDAYVGGVEIYAPEVHDDALRSTDLIVLVDNSAPDRLGRMETIMGEVTDHTLCIDHHPSRRAPWSHLILDEGSCATSVMIYDLVRAAGWDLDREAAEGLYVGLATDTGFFRFNSTDAKAYEVAAELVRLGVDPSGVYQAIYERNSVAFTRLMGHALTGVRVAGGGAVASVSITRDLTERLHAEDVDTSEITTPMLALDGITVALLFRELAGGRVKVSLRAKGVLDVHRLAAEFGGGGHRNASGIVMEGALEDVVRTVTDRTTTLLAG